MADSIEEREETEKEKATAPIKDSIMQKRRSGFV
jgi:hypothetical protein